MHHLAAGPSRRTALRFALTLLCGLVLAACGGGQSEPDPRKLDQFMVDYVDALNREDAAALTRLLGDNHEPAEIAGRISRFGGRDLHDVETFTQREAETTYVLILNALSGPTDTPFEAREIAVWEQERWTLTPYPTQPERGSASPARSSAED